MIPQAVKNILPTLGNEFISLIKETSVVSFVGAADLYVAFNYIGSNSYEFMVPYLVMALIYIALVLIISLLIKLMERSLKKKMCIRDRYKTVGRLMIPGAYAGLLNCNCNTERENEKNESD